MFAKYSNNMENIHVFLPEYCVYSYSVGYSLQLLI